MSEAVVILRPDWDVAGVNAGFTLRTGGVSTPPYDSLNLALHVGDDPARVRDNRHRFIEAAGLAMAPRWLSQVHGTRVIHTDAVDPDITPADGVWSDRPGQPCAVLVADCLPVLLAERDGACVAAVHAGWRGLAAGVIDQVIQALPVPSTRLAACIGPCIGVGAFGVGREVIDAFHAAGRPAVYEQRGQDRRVDLRATARKLLRDRGIGEVADIGSCTHSDHAGCFSYRRDGVTGRLAGFIARR
ncbi:peptidoglycan editing factor PgeF [Spiribacter pallidus]|uniref:Purine nucleoside phosphorylase n=1 Tax=Spiribacter pallidus TaxID=1987936 RepID=A0ABV3TDD4_9GAMM